MVNIRFCETTAKTKSIDNRGRLFRMRLSFDFTTAPVKITILYFWLSCLIEWQRPARSNSLYLLFEFFSSFQTPIKPSNGITKACFGCCCLLTSLVTTRAKSLVRANCFLSHIRLHASAFGSTLWDDLFISFELICYNLPHGIALS